MTLELRGLTRVVGGETHLYEMTATFEPGSFNVLLGPTLAGKTSVLRVMAGLDRPTSGRVLQDGTDITDRPVRKRSVAMVYQEFINYPSFSVYENIASPLRRAGLGRKEIDQRVRRTAEMLHIEALLDRLPAELSGGQQQRTALARALVKQAELVLLDEPLVNLDFKLREELRSELKQVLGEGRSTVIYATTEPLEALLLAGNCLVLHEGRLLQQGPTVSVYERPATVDVARVFSDPPINLIDGRVEADRAQLGSELSVPLTGHLADLAPGDYRFGVRANHLFVSRRSDEEVEFVATVELAEISGSETFVHVSHSGVSWVVQEEGVYSLSLGQRLSVYVDPRHLFVFDPDGRLVAAPHRAVPATAHAEG